MVRRSAAGCCFSLCNLKMFVSRILVLNAVVVRITVNLQEAEHRLAQAQTSSSVSTF